MQEHWQSETMPEEDLDSIAVTPDGRLVVTAKATDRLWTFDAATGETGPSFGGPGVERGLFRRPNGVLRVDDLVLVVERDNRRIQALALPALESLGTFGENALRRPYGITGFPTPGEENRWSSMSPTSTRLRRRSASSRELGERIEHFRLSIVDGELDAEWVRSFGETEGPGVLHKVETLLADPSSSRVVVADELTEAMALRIYEDWGDFHSNVATDLFEGEPEGMALYACEDEGGDWIVTDQFDTDSLFHILDRGSFELLGTFAGPGTAHTDGGGADAAPSRRYARRRFLRGGRRPSSVGLLVVRDRQRARAPLRLYRPLTPSMNPIFRSDFTDSRRTPRGVLHR